MRLNLKMRKLARSTLAVALPITFLILFVSTLGIVAFTYYFAVERVNAQGQTLKVSTAKQSLLGLDDAIVSTLCQPGSSATYALSDSGGLAQVLPQNNTLNITIQDGAAINDIAYNGTVGEVLYQLPYQSSSETGLYLKGNSRPITNQSGASMSQLGIVNGEEHPQIQLRYRPSVTYAVAGEENGRTVNNIRLYVVNLNQSAPIASQGELPLQVSCVNTNFQRLDYEVAYSSGSLTVTSTMDDVPGSVVIPISGTTQGAVIHVETVICNISIQRWIR